MVRPGPSVLLRDATIADAEPIAQLHTDSWRRTYRGMTTDDLEDPGGGHAPNCRYVWARPQLLISE